MRLHCRANDHHGARAARRLAKLAAAVIPSCCKHQCLVIAHMQSYCFLSPFFPTAWTVPLLEASSGCSGIGVAMEPGLLQ